MDANVAGHECGGGRDGSEAVRNRRMGGLIGVWKWIISALIVFDQSKRYKGN